MENMQSVSDKSQVMSTFPDNKSIYLQAVQSINWLSHHLDIIIYQASEMRDDFPHLASMLYVVGDLYQDMSNHLTGGPSFSLPQYTKMIVDKTELSAFAGAFRTSFEYIIQRLRVLCDVDDVDDDNRMVIKLDCIKNALHKKDQGLMNDFYWFNATINSYCHLEDGSVTLWEVSLLISRFHLVMGVVSECVECKKPKKDAVPTKRKSKSSTKSNTKPVMCRHWQGKGKCSLGDKCTFSHTTEKSKLCAFYSAGGCKQGDKCPFTH